MQSKTRRKALTTVSLSIYAACLWSVMRGSLPILALIGRYNIDRTFTAQLMETPLSPGFNLHLFMPWLLRPNPVTYITIVFSLAFLVTSVGILAGKNWARLGFLVLSAIMIVWNLRAISWGRYSLPFYSLAALGFGNWYFRQPKILAFFDATDSSPAIFNAKIRGVTLDLALSLGLFLILLIFEVIGIATLIFAN